MHKLPNWPEMFKFKGGLAHTQPTRLEKREILMRQDQKCALCGCEATLEFDHLGPVRQLVHGQPQIFRAICRPCHQEVTAAQGGCPRLESRFSPRAWREYVCTARAPPPGLATREGGDRGPSEV